MKIICLTTDISTVGGIERMMATICNYFVENYNYDIEIVSLYKMFREKPAFDLNPKIKLSYYNFDVIEPKNIKEKIIQNLNQNRQIKKILKEKNFDIVITFHPHISIPVIVNNRNRKRKVIVTEHSDYDNITKIWKVIRRLLYKKADKVVVLTENNKIKYEKFTSENLCVIPNAISFYTKDYSKLNNNRIIAVGRLEKEKGFDRLIEIAKIVFKECDNWILDIIGDGSEKEYLNSLIKSNNLDSKVRVLEFTNDIKQEYLKSDICVVPSRSEAFSMVILEAMQCGLPVISFNLPGPSTIIKNNYNGVLVKDNDINGFSKEVLKLIKNKELRLKYGQAGKEYSKIYSIDSIGKQWNNLFENLM